MRLLPLALTFAVGCAPAVAEPASRPRAQFSPPERRSEVLIVSGVTLSPEVARALAARWGTPISLHLPEAKLIAPDTTNAAAQLEPFVETALESARRRAHEVFSERLPAIVLASDAWKRALRGEGVLTPEEHLFELLAAVDQAAKEARPLAVDAARVKLSWVRFSDTPSASAEAHARELVDQTSLLTEDVSPLAMARTARARWDLSHQTAHSIADQAVAEERALLRPYLTKPKKL